MKRKHLVIIIGLSLLLLMAYVNLFPLQISSITVTAKSGSVTDIQAAVDSVASSGGTVYIPEGTFSFDVSGDRRVEFTVPERGIQIIGAGIDQTVLQMPIDDSAPNSVMFDVNGLSGGKIRITGITFKGRSNRETSPTGDTGIRLKSCTNFRVDHCSFYDMGGNGVQIYDAKNTYGWEGGNIDKVSQGVIDHCSFYGIYKSACTSVGRGFGYGVVVGRAWHYLWTVPNLYPNSPWNSTDGYGKYYKNTFIEDCYFTGCRHAVVGNWAGAYVLRHSVMEDDPIHDCMTTGHPVRSNVLGMYYCEIYGNIIKRTGIYSASFSGILVEGGSALIYNNVIDNLGSQAPCVIGTSEVVNPEFYPLGNTKETYIWNNELIDTPSTIAVTTNAGGTPVEGIDFFTDLTGMYTTEQIQAMIDAKDYQPYTYPHPLIDDSQELPPPPPEEPTTEEPTSGGDGGEPPIDEEPTSEAPTGELPTTEPPTDDTALLNQQLFIIGVVGVVTYLLLRRKKN